MSDKLDQYCRPWIAKLPNLGLMSVELGQPWAYGWRTLLTFIDNGPMSVKLAQSYAYVCRIDLANLSSMNVELDRSCDCQCWGWLILNLCLSTLTNLELMNIERPILGLWVSSLNPSMPARLAQPSAFECQTLSIPKLYASTLVNLGPARVEQSQSCTYECCAILATWVSALIILGPMSVSLDQTWAYDGRTKPSVSAWVSNLINLMPMNIERDNSWTCGCWPWPILSL